jgi:hypothetical protein
VDAVRQAAAQVAEVDLHTVDDDDAGQAAQALASPLLRVTQLGTLAALSGRHSDVSQPHLTAVSQQARRSLASGGLSPFRMSSQMTFNNGTQPDQLVLGKRVHNHLLPPAKPGWRRSSTRRRLGPPHQV